MSKFFGAGNSCGDHTIFLYCWKTSTTAGGSTGLQMDNFILEARDRKFSPIPSLPRLWKTVWTSRLSLPCWHASAATTLDIYTHIIGDMLSEAVAKIDRGLDNEVAEDSSEAAQNPLTNFRPVMRRTRKLGIGYITELNDHLFEGCYSPSWPDGTKHSKCVYAHIREECEEKLKVLIQQLSAERKAILDRLRGIPSPEKLTKKQRQIWEYMRLCPDETNYSTIAKGAKVTRHTVAKHFEMIQKMLGIQKTAPHPLLDCQTVPLMV